MSNFLLQLNQYSKNGGSSEIYFLILVFGTVAIIRYVYKIKVVKFIKENKFYFILNPFFMVVIVGLLLYAESDEFVSTSIKYSVYKKYGDVITFAIEFLLMILFVAIFELFYRHIYLRYIKKHIYNHEKEIIDEIPLDK